MGAFGERHGIPIRELLAFVPFLVLKGEVWRLVSGAFINMTVWGLFFTLVIIYQLGKDLLAHWSPIALVVAFLLAEGFGTAVVLLNAAVFDVGMRHGHLGSEPAIGALIVAWAHYFPEKRLLQYLVLPLQGRILTAC